MNKRWVLVHFDADDDFAVEDLVNVMETVLPYVVDNVVVISAPDVQEDNDGQLVIYTGVHRDGGNKQLHAVCPWCQKHILLLDRKDWESYSGVELMKHYEQAHPVELANEDDSFGIPYAEEVWE